MARLSLHANASSIQTIDNIFSGFLSWNDNNLPGNMGLQDQVLALKWVRENIEKFGADITKITLLGHSAGAASAAFHLTSRRSHGI